MKPVLLILLFATSPAFATVDALLSVVYASTGVHRGGYCLHERQMIANIGIFPASVMNGAFQKVMIFDENRADGVTMIDFNVLSEAEPSYIYDEYDTIGYGDHLRYRMGLDVSKLALGKSRQEAMDLIKLAIVVANKNAQAMAKTYELWVELEGLPEQDGTTSERVYPVTEYPYTATSPLLNTYIKELESRTETGETLYECF